MSYKVIKSDHLSKPGDQRYIVIDSSSNNVLDDAQGYGYRSKEKAIAAYEFKSRPTDEQRKIYEKDKAVLDWLDKNKSFMNRVNDEMWYAMKDGEDFGTQDIKSLLKNMEIECPFSVYEIWNGIKYGKSRYAKLFKKSHKK